MNDDGIDGNDAKMPAIENGVDDSVRSEEDAVADKNIKFQPSSKRRKRCEDDTNNNSDEEEEKDNTSKPPALKRKRETETASSEKSSRSNFPFAASIDEYLQSPHDYAPRPEWCHPTNNNSAPSPIVNNQGVEFAGVASIQNAAAADQAAAARMNAAAAFERLIPAGNNNNLGANNPNGNIANNANNDNDDRHNALPQPHGAGNDFEANMQNFMARLRNINEGNPAADLNAIIAAAAQELANNYNRNRIAIPLAAVPRQMNAPNRNNDHDNNNNNNRERRHHHRRRRILQHVAPGGGGGGAQQQLGNAIGNIRVGAEQLGRAIGNMPGISAQQRELLRSMIAERARPRRPPARQVGQQNRVAGIRIDQVREVLRQGGVDPALLGGGGQPAAPLLNLQARQQQPVPQQQQQPMQQGPIQQLQPAEVQQPLQQQNQAEAQQPVVHERQVLLFEPNPPAHANAVVENPPDEANVAAGLTSNNSNEANNDQATGNPGKIAVFGNDLDTLLHLAIKRGAVDAALDLIEEGACIDFPNAKGITPLMVASQEGNVVIARALLNKGAKANNTTVRGSTALIQACHFGRLSVVEELLKHGALIEQSNHKNTTALMRSSQEGHESVVKLLLQHNAVVNRRNDERMTALMLCSQRGHSGIVKMLLKAGAEIDAKTAQDSTSLMLACKRKNLEVAKILVAAGTELKLKDCKNRTVLETATRRGNADFARILTDDAQIRLVKEEARRERNFCMIRLWHLLNWERASIRAPPINLMVHSLAEDLNNPALQHLCPSKRALVRAMTMPAPVIELITAFIPLPLCWEKRLSILSSRSHVDPDTAMYNALDLIDEVLEEGGMLEAFDLAEMQPPVSFHSWSHFRGWCGRCDVILSRCQNEDTNSIFARDTSIDDTPRLVESAQSQRRRSNYLQVISLAPNDLANVLASPPYRMPPILLEKLKSNGDIQSLARRLTSGIHFERK